MGYLTFWNPVNGSNCCTECCVEYVVEGYSLVSKYLIGLHIVQRGSSEQAYTSRQEDKRREGKHESSKSRRLNEEQTEEQVKLDIAPSAN